MDAHPTLFLSIPHAHKSRLLIISGLAPIRAQVVRAASAVVTALVLPKYMEAVAAATVVAAIAVTITKIELQSAACLHSAPALPLFLGLPLLCLHAAEKRVPSVSFTTNRSARSLSHRHRDTHRHTHTHALIRNCDRAGHLSVRLAACSSRLFVLFLHRRS